MFKEPRWNGETSYPYKSGILGKSGGTGGPGFAETLQDQDVNFSLKPDQMSKVSEDVDSDSEGSIIDIPRPDMRQDRNGRHDIPAGLDGFLRDFLEGSGIDMAPETPMISRMATSRAGPGKSQGDAGRLENLLANLIVNDEQALAGMAERRQMSEQRELAKTHEHWRPLHLTAQMNKVTLAQALLKKGAAVDAREDDDWTPLMLAAQEGHLDMAELLLENGADVNAQANDGRCALFQASMNNRLDVVRTILARKPIVDLQTTGGLTSLWVSVVRGSSDPGPSRMAIVKALLEAGADPNRPDNDGAPPLSVAMSALEDDEDAAIAMAELLLEHGADINNHTPAHLSALMRASLEGCADMVRMCLAHNARVNDVDKDGWTALHLAVQNNKPGTLATLRMLLDAGIEVDARTQENATALIILCQHDYPELLRLLVEQGGADVNGGGGQRDRTPIFWAVGNGCRENFRYLVEKGARLDVVDGSGTTLIHMAVLQNDVAFAEEVVSMCVKAGVDIDARRGDDNATALHIATSNDEDGLAIMLLEHGAAP